MKLFLITLICLFVAIQARSHRRSRDVQSTVNELKDKFPMAEWKTFWGKLTEVLGSQRAEFEKKLEENKGNMDLTLDQFKDKLTDKYPQIKTQYEAVKTKWAALQEKLKTTTLKDVGDFLKEKFQKYAQTLNYDNFNTFLNDAKVYLQTYWGQVAGQ